MEFLGNIFTFVLHYHFFLFLNGAFQNNLVAEEIILLLYLKSYKIMGSKSNIKTCKKRLQVKVFGVFFGSHNNLFNAPVVHFLCNQYLIY